MVSENTVENYIDDKRNSENIEADKLPFDHVKHYENTIQKYSFKPDNLCTEEEKKRKHEIAVKGGKARNEQLKQRKTMRESAETLLQTAVSREYAAKVLGENFDISGVETMQDLITARMLREILENGNTKAAEFIRDTSGNKPISTAALDITADIVTAADRSLIEKVADRLGVVDITDENDD